MSEHNTIVHRLLARDQARPVGVTRTYLILPGGAVVAKNECVEIELNVEGVRALRAMPKSTRRRKVLAILERLASGSDFTISVCSDPTLGPVFK